MKVFARILMLTGAVVLASSVSSYAVAVWFGDQSYTSLEELDLALEEGDISETEYDILVGAFLSGALPDSTDYLDIRLVDKAEFQEQPQRREEFGLRYRATLIQDLDADYGIRRYDRLRYQRNGWKSELSLERNESGGEIIRSRYVDYRRGGRQVTLGSYSLKLGQGVTIGNSPFTSKLRDNGTLGQSFLLPVKNRENGILIKLDQKNTRFSLFASQLEGADYYRRSAGGMVAVDFSAAETGLIFLHQQIGDRHGNSHRANFLAPAFAIKYGAVKLAGESSFELGGGSAHLYSIESSGSGAVLRQQLLLLSYSTQYRNPQSGGYAYSDYEQIELNDFDFSYSDKRSGRIGIALSSRYKAGKNMMVRGDVVRWRNRIDDRQCVAARGLVKFSRRGGFLKEVSLRGIWEDFDLTNRIADQRRLISTTFRLDLQEKQEVRFYSRWEERRSGSSPKYPLRLQCDWKGAISRNIRGGIGSYYYDPDSRRRGDDYLAVYLEQNVRQTNWVDLTFRCKSRYYRVEARWRDWEVRAEADVHY